MQCRIDGESCIKKYGDLVLRDSTISLSLADLSDPPTTVYTSAGQGLK